MKTIKKLKFKNTLGITEINLEPKQINVIEGKCGSGKTSILDSITTALSNKNIRADFIRKGEDEASIFVELSDGTTIDRVKSLDKSDKIKVLSEGFKGSPETYLKSMFNDKQFRPVDFIEATVKDQNKTLLGLVDISWSKEDIQEWFNDVPEWVNYDEHILDILGQIQAKNGEYYLTREDKNRDVRNKTAIAKEIIDGLPENYTADSWRETKLSDLYAEVTTVTSANQKIFDDQAFLVNMIDKEASIELKFSNKQQEIRDNATTMLSENTADIQRIENTIRLLQEEIDEKLQSAKDIKTNADHAIELSKKDMLNEKAELNAVAKKIDKKAQPVDVVPLREKAENAEKMKNYLNEYDNAMTIYKEIEQLTADSVTLTEKIEKARSLPGELLQKFSSPIENLSVVDGSPRINGLPIKNLSTGEQLALAVDIAVLLAGDLKVILVDRFESLDKTSQDLFIKKCKESGCQFFLTRVSDTEYNIVSYD